MKKRGILSCSIVCVIVVTILWGLLYNTFFTQKGSSHNNHEYYMSEAFIDAACQAYLELERDFSRITWLYQNVDEGRYYVRDEQIERIYYPSESITFLFEHGALGLQLSPGKTLIIVDFLSYSKEEGCVIKPYNPDESVFSTLLWEKNGFAAYIYSQNR